MEARLWGAVAVAVAVCTAGCAQSHPPAAELPPGDLADVTDVDAGPAPLLPRCGAPDPELPVLLGMDGTEVWMRWLDGRQERVHSFDRDDPAFRSGVQPMLRLADAHLLVSIGGELTQQGIRPRSHALLTRDGELLWARSWAADEGGEVEAFGADGSVVLLSQGRYSWVQPDGSERQIAAGFIPLEAPDAEGWMPGMFSQDDGSTVHGFQHIVTDQRRLVVGETRSDLRELGSQDLVGGRFYYTFIDTAGVVSLGVEGPDSQTTFVLEGETELPYLTRGPTHTLVHVGTRPVALLERAALKLTKLVAPAQDAESAEDAENGRQLYLRADGDWFVVTVQNANVPLDTSHRDHVPPVERVYRIHAPTGRLDAEPAPPVPEGLARFDYSICYQWASGQSVNGQLVQALAPLDAETPLVQLYLEGPGDEGEGWTALGRPVAYGMGPSAQQVGESWLLRSGDVRNTYCNYPWIDEPSALGPEVLLGQSVQVVAPDGEIIAFDVGADGFGVLDHGISLSVDGRCALIRSGAEYRIHDLTTHDEQVIDLPNARWLEGLGEPP